MLDGSLRMSVTFIGLVKPPHRDPLYAENYIIRPLFRILKCMDQHTESAQGGKCMVFVDEFGWVYKNWADYQANTQYKDTIVVAPTAGYFSRQGGQVQLTHFIVERVPGLSPIVYAAVAAVGVFNPYVGIGLGITAAIKSAGALRDIHAHEQDIFEMRDSEIRQHWLSIIQGGLGAICAGHMLCGVETSNYVFGTTLAVSSASFVNALHRGIVEGHGFTRHDILGMVSTLLIFGHSFYNYPDAGRDLAEAVAALFTRCAGRIGRRRGDITRALMDNVDPVDYAERGLEVVITGLLRVAQCELQRVKAIIIQEIANLIGGEGELRNILKDMAQSILTRLGNGHKLTLKWITDQCLRLIIQYTRLSKTPYKEIVKEIIDYCRRTRYEDFPSFIRYFFDLFVPRPGTKRCEECDGVYYAATAA